MENNLENLTIGVFAKAAGVNVETIRFYQRKGLLREPDKPYGGPDGILNLFHKKQLNQLFFMCISEVFG